MDDGSLTQLALPTDARERGDAESLRTALWRELRSDRWREGERLPTERALVERYSLARNTVRRALQSLEAEGLIVRHVGRGTFKASAASFPADPGFGGPGFGDMEGISPADVVECRLAFEPELASLVVARASQADLDRMEECLRGGEAAPDIAVFETWDGALHDAIAIATRNQAIITMARALARVRLRTEWGELKARSMTATRKQALQIEHRAIVEAFRRRDKADARMRLREHILQVQASMFGE